MPCGTAGICGISSCFQLLSPGMRQVIHALLTRPPLSLRTLPTEIVRVRRSVRLACVKHAASVHPEPGSNSLAKFISPGFRLFLSILLSRTVILKFLTVQRPLFPPVRRWIQSAIHRIASFIRLALAETSDTVQQEICESLYWVVSVRSCFYSLIKEFSGTHPLSHSSHV